MNIYDPSITELDEVYTYYETNSETVIPPLGVQVGWNCRYVIPPSDLEEILDSTEFQRLEWARFLPDPTSEYEADIRAQIFRQGWEEMHMMLNSFRPMTPKQQLQHDGDYEKDDTDPIEGMSYEELDRLI